MRQRGQAQYLSETVVTRVAVALSKSWEVTARLHGLSEGKHDLHLGVVSAAGRLNGLGGSGGDQRVCGMAAGKGLPRNLSAPAPTDRNQIQ